MPFSHFFISKHRKVEFELHFTIQDITNVPLVSGSYFVKWKLRNASVSSGVTTKEHIKEHCVVWSFPVTTSVEIVISKQHVLTPCELKLEIYQEVGGSGGAKAIGTLCINLSEYAASGFVTKRYLLEDCKFNSFIKLSIEMKQITNVDEPFSVPPPSKPQQQTDISKMIANSALEKRDDCLTAHSVPASTSDRSLRQQHQIHSHHQQQQKQQQQQLQQQQAHISNGISKSQSALSLPPYCSQNPSFLPSDDPSPSDLVEQLFTPKPDIETASY